MATQVRLAIIIIQVPGREATFEQKETGNLARLPFRLDNFRGGALQANHAAAQTLDPNTRSPICIDRTGSNLAPASVHVRWQDPDSMEHWCSIARTRQ